MWSSIDQRLASIVAIVGVEGMEHRCAPRVAKQVNVVLHVSGSTLVTGVTRDISCDGLSLNINEPGELRKAKSQQLSRNQVVRVAINTGERLVILPSLVLRSDDRFTALLFSEQAAVKKQILKEYLYGGKAVELRDPVLNPA